MAKLGFEEDLWKAADKLRGNINASDYRNVVLGLIFLKYISDAFEERYKQLLLEVKDGADPEDPDEYKSNIHGKSVFWVPKESRWEFIQERAKLDSIGLVIDSAMELIEKENSRLKGILPKEYANPTLDKRRLGELVDLIGRITLIDTKHSQDILGRVYEYFLGQFASAEGKKGGEFYTPDCIVKLLVEMIEPFKGRVYDPCCGSGGMFVQSEKFVIEHSGKINDISIYGQESNPTTWKLANMNLAIRGIEADIKFGDSFHEDLHPDLKADFILANPPFNISDWGGNLLTDDKRWKYGVPPTGNANFAWVQHMIHHLSTVGIAGFVLANGSMSSNTSSEGEIRTNIIKAGLVDAIVALPSQLFYNTQIPACLWFIRRGKEARKGETLFIDAREMGEMISRKNRTLTDEDIKKIAGTYHVWRNGGNYEDIAGFSKSADISEIEKQGFILTPGRYVGFKEEEDDGIPFEEKMEKLVSELKKTFEEGEILDKRIKENLKELGYDI